MDVVWYQSVNNGLFMFEELKLEYMQIHPNEKFEFCNFNVWADDKGFKRIN